MELLRKKPLEVLQVEPTRRCNLKCKHCTRGESFGNMSCDTYIGLLDKHKDAKVVKLQGLGEPMFHPSIHKFIDIAKERGHEVMVITNGTIRLPDHVDHLVVSLETMNADRYRLLRDGDVKRVLDNIHDGYERNLPMTINCVQTNLTNQKDVEEVSEFACSIGAKLWILPQEVWVDPKHRKYPEYLKYAKEAAFCHQYLEPPFKQRMKTCVWRHDLAIYYDYSGKRHPCCIRMDDEYLGAPSNSIGCTSCPW